MIFLALIGALGIGLILRLIGSGGSILTVPVLIVLLHRPEKLAIIESLAIIALIGLSGAISSAFRHEIHWKSVFLFGLPGMIGAAFGAHVSSFLNGSFQLLFFSLLMFVVAGMMMFPSFTSAPPLFAKPSVLNESVLVSVQRVSKMASIFSLVKKGFLVGGVTGLVGVGGGFLIVPALLVFAHLSMSIAVGTSLAIIFLNALIGFLIQLYSLQDAFLKINMPVIAIFSLVGMLGSLFGHLYVNSISDGNLKKIFAFFVFFIGLYLFCLSLNLIAPLA